MFSKPKGWSPREIIFPKEFRFFPFVFKRATFLLIFSFSANFPSFYSCSNA